jgi:antitoxin HigA-1
MQIFYFSWFALKIDIDHFFCSQFAVHCTNVGVTPKKEIKDMAREPIHPGEILADELEELGISAAELARRLKVPPNRISQIISGKRSITADTALRLGKWFGTGPKIWLNLQQAYDLDLAKLQLAQDLEDIKPREAA